MSEQRENPPQQENRNPLIRGAIEAAKWLIVPTYMKCKEEYKKSPTQANKNELQSSLFADAVMDTLIGLSMTTGNPLLPVILRGATIVAVMNKGKASR